MLHAHRIAASGQWPREQGRGTVTLSYDNRHRRRVRLTTDAGEPVMLDLAQATVLGDGDGLVLDEGGFIAVRAAPEDLVEVMAATPGQLARLAWHIGNRHFPAELRERSILIRDDHVMVDMLVGLGAAVRRMKAPFNPEGGAYAQGGAEHHHHDHDHGHHHDHGHDHDHDHHHGHHHHGR
jgi:urease accessory protein